MGADRAPAGGVAGRAGRGARAHHRPARGGQRDLLRRPDWGGPGGICPMTSRRTPRSTATSGRGRRTVPPRKSTTPCVSSYAGRRVVGSCRRRGDRCPDGEGVTERAGEHARVRRWQEGQGPQAAYRRRHPRVAAGSHRHGRWRAGHQRQQTRQKFRGMGRFFIGTGSYPTFSLTGPRGAWLSPRGSATAQTAPGRATGGPRPQVPPR